MNAANGSRTDCLFQQVGNRACMQAHASDSRYGGERENDRQGLAP
jgi:hypothetical protein